MMNRVLVVITIIFILLSVLQIVLLRRSQKSNLLFKNQLYKTEAEAIKWRENSEINYKVGHSIVDTLALCTNAGASIQKISTGNNLLLCFPDNVCEICQKELFDLFFRIKEQTREIIVLVSVVNYRDFVGYSKEYHLEFKHVNCFRKPLFVKAKEFEEPFFVLQKENGELVDFFLLKKPIQQQEISWYIDLMMGKINNN